MSVDPRDNAFPIFNRDGEVYFSQGGLSKREYFAALAMQGLVGSSIGEIAGPGLVADIAVHQADALIAALNGEGQANG